MTCKMLSLILLIYLVLKSIFFSGLNENTPTVSSYIVKDTSTSSDGKTVHRCILCGKTGRDRSNLRKHVESVHFPSSFQFSCQYCGKVFHAKNSLYNHTSTHHREQKQFVI